MTITQPLIVPPDDQHHVSVKYCRCSKLRIVSIICVLLIAWILIMYTCNTHGRCCFLSLKPPVTPHVIHTKRRLPKCIIIGVRKGGTRAMLQFLDLHPDIVTAPNEVHFFDRDENYSRGLDWYKRHMPYSSKHQITIEKTPSYFNSAGVPERLYKMNDRMKLILLVRDPVERSISDYTQIHYNKLSRGKYHIPFRDLAIDADTGRVRRTYVAIKRSVYYRHMLKWLQWFTLDDFLIVDSAELIDKPFDVVNRVETFLGLSHKLGKDNFYFNQTRGFYCMKNDTMQRCLSKSKGRAHVHVDADTIDRLREFFREFNQKFYNLIGRDFDW